MKPTKRSSVVEKNIPSHLARPVGHIITKWAYLEHQLSRITWRLLGLTPQEGRLSVATPRARDRLQTIRSLLFLHKRDIEEKKYDVMTKRLHELEGLRDTLAHSIWVKHDNAWKIVKTNSKVTDQTLHPVARSQKIRPESMAVTTSNLNAIVKAIEDQITSLDTLETYVASLLKPPEQFGEDHHTIQKSRTLKQKTPPQSFRA